MPESNEGTMTKEFQICRNPVLTEFLPSKYSQISPTNFLRSMDPLLCKKFALLYHLGACLEDLWALPYVFSVLQDKNKLRQSIFIKFTRLIVLSRDTRSMIICVFLKVILVHKTREAEGVEQNQSSESLCLIWDRICWFGNSMRILKVAFVDWVSIFAVCGPP